MMTVKQVKGRAKGGVAAANALSPDERKERAKAAAMARWDNDIPVAAYGTPDHPLKIGDLEIPCYVLDDERRVLIQGGMLRSLDMSQGTAGRGGGDRLVKFINTKSISPFVSNELASMITNPIRFKIGGSIAYGYEATILADLCDVVLKARADGTLNYQQEHIARQCEILVRSFAKVGIISLVDEATGYQRERAADALAEILEKFIAKELRPWIHTFPSEYYQELYRLRSLDFPKDTVKRPAYFGHLTNDIIYKRLAPGVLDELKKKTPKGTTGRHKQQLHRRLSKDIGHPKLLAHLDSVVTVMKLTDDGDYDGFIDKLDRVKPRYNETMAMDFKED